VHRWLPVPRNQTRAANPIKAWNSDSSALSLTPFIISLLHLLGWMELCSSHGRGGERVGRMPLTDFVVSAPPILGVVAETWAEGKRRHRSAPPLFFVYLRPCPRSPSSIGVGQGRRLAERKAARRAKATSYSAAAHASVLQDEISWPGINCVSWSMKYWTGSPSITLSFKRGDDPRLWGHSRASIQDRRILGKNGRISIVELTFFTQTVNLPSL
jgi:hypothetical protein